jgi:hypothetical protein
MNRSLQPSDLLTYASRIDLSCYDRTPELTPDERQIASRWAGHERRVITKRQLPRLYKPLVEVLSYLGIPRAERSATIKIILIEVWTIRAVLLGMERSAMAGVDTQSVDSNRPAARSGISAYRL